MSQIVTPNGKRIIRLLSPKKKGNGNPRRDKTKEFPRRGQRKDSLTDIQVAEILALQKYWTERNIFSQGVRYAIFMKMYPTLSYYRMIYVVKKNKRKNLPTISPEALNLLLELALK